MVLKKTMSNIKEDPNPIVFSHFTLTEVMRIIDKYGIGIAIVVSDEQKTVQGLITDGDIRRALLKGESLTGNIIPYIRKNFISVTENTPLSHVKAILDEKVIHQIPELNSKNQLIKIHTYHSINKPQEEKFQSIKRVLVIGGGGYVGHHVIKILLEKGYTVRCLDIKLYGDFEDGGIKHAILSDDVEFIKGDMRSISDLIPAIQGVDAVILLGAIVGDPASKEMPEMAISANYLSASLVAMTCKYFQINRLVFFSTCSVYGKGDGLLTENSSLEPVSLYGRNKVDAEKAILSLTDSNFQPTILRLGTIFGVSGRMRFDLVINLLTAKATIENEISIHGGDQWRPLLHVYDAARAAIVVLESPLTSVGSKIFNVGSNKQNYQMKELAPMFNKIYPRLNIIFNEDLADPRDYRVDFSKIKKELGFDTSITVEDAILEIKDYIEKHKINYEDIKYSNYKSLADLNII
jgi:nucleoside-diphosphate-sugar epimerase/CBS domain-containing protein